MKSVISCNLWTNTKHTKHTTHVLELNENDNNYKIIIIIIITVVFVTFILLVDTVDEDYVHKIIIVLRTRGSSSCRRWGCRSSYCMKRWKGNNVRVMDWDRKGVRERKEKKKRIIEKKEKSIVDNRRLIFITELE